MKIRNIHIDGFGQFAGNEFGPLVRPVTVFHGPNEAGKSTLLEFIRTILFGFRPRSGRPPRGGWPNDYAPLAGGRHGGRVTLVNGDGQHSIVERFSGGRVGRVTVAVGASVTQDEAVLAQLLGNHSRAVFERIFAFTLDELYSDDLLNDENVNSQIYSAGMGVTLLPNAMRSVESARRDIFLKGGSSQNIYEVYSKIEEIDGGLQKVADNAVIFGNLTTRLEQVHTQIEDLTARRHRLQSRHSHQVRLQNAWDPWNDLLSAKRELANLPIIDNFPTNGISRLETLQERVRLASQEYESTGRRVAEAQGRVDVQIEHEPILTHSAEIRGIERSRTSFDNSVHDQPEREAELAECERTLAETLRDLGPSWDEARLRAFNLPITTNQEISQYGERLREADEQFRLAESNFHQANVTLKETAGRVEHEVVLTHSTEISRIERGRTSFDHSVHDLPKREAELSGHKRSLAETLKDLGPGWDEGRLETFDLSIAVREEISQYQERLRETGGELERRKATLAQEQTALAEAAEAENHVGRELKAATKPSLDQEQARQRRALIRTAASRLRQMQSAREQVSVLQGQLDGLATPMVPVKRTTSSKAVGTIGVIVGIAFLVGGPILGGPALSVGIAAGLALVAIAAYIFAAGPSSPGSGTESPLASSLRDSLSRTTADLTAFRSMLEQDAASLGLETIDEASLIAAEGSLDDDEALIRVWANLSESLERAEDLTKRRKSRSQQSQEAVKETNGELETVQQEWQEWLRVRRLRDTFAPEAVVELRSKVELGLTQLREVQSWRQRIKAIQKDIDEYIEVVGPLASAFEIPFDGNKPSTVAAAADRLVELHNDVERNVRKRRDAEGVVENVQHRLLESKKRLETVQQEWKEWIQVHGLQDGLTPSTVVRLQERVEIGRNHLENVRNCHQRIEAIRKDIDKYIEVVGPLASAFEIPFDGNKPSTVAAAADMLIELFERVQARVKDRTDAKTEVKNTGRQLEERKGDLGTVEEELTQLLRSGDAEDAEDFRLRADLFKKRAGLDEHMRTALNRLQRLSGPGEPLESLKTDLSRTDSQSIADEIDRLEEERANADSQIEKLSTERGSIQTELQRLVGEEESSRLRIERNVLCEQIRGHARDWTRFTLAQNLLEEARRKFERERQPGVVRHAQQFFAEITEERYRQVYAPLGEQTITVTDADGRTKQPSELSRGTREQLFLSLRFGLIRELGQRTEPLPVVVDEILVNFDPERALRAAVAFVELSHTNQVLVFTCQPTVVELFRSAASETGVEAPDEVRIA